MSNATVYTGSTGGGEAHENMPPYYALCYIIKISTSVSENDTNNKDNELIDESRE